MSPAVPPLASVTAMSALPSPVRSWQIRESTPAIRGGLPRLDLCELGLRHLELLLRPPAVDLLRLDRVVDECDRPVLRDGEEAGAGGELEHRIALAEVHPRGAGLECCDERRMP